MTQLYLKRPVVGNGYSTTFDLGLIKAISRSFSVHV